MGTRWLEKLLILASDLLAGGLAFGFVVWLQFFSGRVPGAVQISNFSDFPEQLLQPLGILTTAWIVVFLAAGLYRRWMTASRTFQLWVLIRTVTFGGFLLSLVLFGPHVLDAVLNAKPIQLIFNPFVPLLGWYLLVFLGATAVGRMGVQWLMHVLLAKGIGTDPVVIVGRNAAGGRLADQLKSTPQLGYRPVGFVSSPDEAGSDDPALESQGSGAGLFHGLPLLGSVKELGRVVDEQKARGIVLALGGSREELFNLLGFLGERTLPIFVIPDLYDVVAGNFKTGFVHNTNLKELFPQHMPPWQVPLKRLVDLLVAGVLLVLSLPLVALTALAIKLESPGPVFYVQERVGQYGRNFRLAKFRSMRTDAEKDGPQWAQERDPRVTRVGRIIRAVRIDEIPQFWNVLLGEMSMVGPRPERPHFVEQLRQQIPYYSRRLVMKPGITGWAQVRHHYDGDIEDVRTKVLHDLYYWENMSLLLDVQILIRTVWVVLTGHGSR